MLAYPRSDHQYALITDTSFGDENTASVLSAILTQLDEKGQFYAIAYASCKLQKYEENYTPIFARNASCNFWNRNF